MRESAAEKVARDTPALPGDVIVEEGGCRYLVRWAELRSRMQSAPCGCCSEQTYDYLVFIDEPWDGPTEVIATGGGTVLTMTLKEWWGDWPPEKATVFRDGQPIYGGGPLPAMPSKWPPRSHSD